MVQWSPALVDLIFQQVLRPVRHDVADLLVVLAKNIFTILSELSFQDRSRMIVNMEEFRETSCESKLKNNSKVVPLALVTGSVKLLCQSLTSQFVKVILAFREAAISFGANTCEGDDYAVGVHFLYRSYSAWNIGRGYGMTEQVQRAFADLPLPSNLAALAPMHISPSGGISKNTDTPSYEYEENQKI